MLDCVNGPLGALDKDGINSIIYQVCEANGRPDLASCISWEFSTSLTATIGQALIYKNLIKLSAPLWGRTPVDERANTIAHEVCHLLAVYIYGFNVKGHGDEWRNLMIKAGYEPTRCHNIDTSGIEGKRGKSKRYLADCDCRTHTITKNRVTKMQNGKVYYCKNCKVVLNNFREITE